MRRTGPSREAAEERDVTRTHHFEQTVAERAKRDPIFARALLDEAATLFLNGEPHSARLILRDLVSAAIGFETLAVATAKPAKSLYRMLSKQGRAIRPWTISPRFSACYARSWEWISRLTPSKRCED
jgi:hypothetical protein